MDFKSFGKPVKLTDFNSYTPDCDPSTGIPLMQDFIHSTHFKVPLIAFNAETIVKFLEEGLSKIKKIICEKKEHFIYSIDYFPIEGLKIYPNDKLHKYKFFVQSQAATKAYNKFPHNIDNYEESYRCGFNEPIVSLDNWFKAEIRLYLSKKENCYFLEIVRLSGDGCSFYRHLFNILKEEVFDEKNLLWFMRANYVNLCEGIDKVKKPDHITHYLLNELICKEVCSFFFI